MQEPQKEESAKRGFSLKKGGMILLMLVILVVCFFVFISWGSTTIPVENVIGAVLGGGSELERNVVMNIRLPRSLIAVMAGANLAISGALLQAVMKNPLADPGLTGVSTGASVVAIVIMLIFPALTAFVPVFAFIGALLTCMLVYSLAWKKGLSPVRIILAGVAINSILGAVIAVLSILYSDQIQGVLFWTSGSIAGKYYPHVMTLLPYTIVGVLAAFLTIKQTNILQLGDDMARNLGHNPNILRLIISAIAAFTAGITVSIVGVIGFVGLVTPHFARMIVGSDYKYLLPMSALMGALLVLIGDTFARTAFAPIELPVGVFMAVLGGPFFLWLLRKKG